MEDFAQKWQEMVNIPEMLLSLGEDLEREGLEETPRRVGAAWREFLNGYTQDPSETLETVFEVEGEGLQLCRNIEFTSMCEHHLLPIIGVVHIGYIPNEMVCGLSKLARLVDCLSRRLQIQERLSQQIADVIEEVLEPKGVLVVTKAKHLCCIGRGVKQPRMDYVCSAQHGDVKTTLYELLLR